MVKDLKVEKMVTSKDSVPNVLREKYITWARAGQFHKILRSRTLSF